MKNWVGFILVCFFFTGLLGSCGRNNRSMLVLKSADSVMERDPEEAMKLVKSINIKSLKNDEERAYYALVKTESDDKNYIKHTDSRLIRQAVDYYGNKKDRLKASKSYFYMGRVNQDMGDLKRAIESYLKTIDLIPKNGDSHYKMIVYNNLGDCYEAEDYYNEALKAFRKSFLVSLKGKNKTESFYGLERIGNIYIYQARYDSALYYYRTALSIVETAKDSMLTNVLLFDMAKAQYYKKDYRLSYKILNQSFHLKRPESEMYPVYYYMALLQFQFNRNDSAKYYTKLSLKSQDVYAQAASMQLLYKIAKNEKLYEIAVIYNDKFISIKDSIDNIKDPKIGNIIRNNALEEQRKDLELKSQRRVFLIMSGFLILIIVGMFVFYYYDKNKKREIDSILKESNKYRSNMYKFKREYDHIRERQEEITYKKQLFYIQKNLLDVNAAIFKKSPVYKNLTSQKNQKEKTAHGKEADTDRLYEEIDSIFKDFRYALSYGNDLLTFSDLHYIILSYLGIQEKKIFDLMKIQSKQSLKQRRYRIRKKLNEDIFNYIFSADS